MKLLSITKAADKIAFEKKASSDKPILLLHYADYCGHCIRFKPTWVTVAAALAANRGVHVVEIEANNADILKKYTKDIRGYPTIRVLKNGTFTEYTGARALAPIVNFANSHIADTRA
jgi:protein disulfide-isomerase A1